MIRIKPGVTKIAAPVTKVERRVTKVIGRPRTYASAAEKQAAYRVRKKAAT